MREDQEEAGLQNAQPAADKSIPVPTQIEDMLENMSDGLMALDMDRRYTYANKTIGSMVHMDPAGMIGHRIWDLFPEVVGTPTYWAIETALTEKRFIINEDYFAPLGFWQENRVYPTKTGISVFIRDITDRKRVDELARQSQERFSIISKATNDALFDRDLKTNEIWWSESHYTMFGFDPLLPLPSEAAWLQCIHPDTRPVFTQNVKAVFNNELKNWQHEVKYLRPDKAWGTLLHRGFVIDDEHGKPARMLGSFIDITDRKNEESQKEILSAISFLFKTDNPMPSIMQHMLELVMSWSNCQVAEMWLVRSNKRLALAAQLAENKEVRLFPDDNGHKRLSTNEQLAGHDWAGGISQFRPLTAEQRTIDTGLQAHPDVCSSLSVPINYNGEVSGVLMLYFNTGDNPLSTQKSLLSTFGTYLGTEIKHYQLEQQLHLLFDRAPDIICIVGTDRHFKKVNPAMSALLEYTEAELLTMTIDDLIHPDDVAISKTRMKSFVDGAKTLYFENRYVAKCGKSIWLSWTASRAPDEGILFCVGKNISDKKELENLLQKANELSRTGGWELDLVKETVYWSDITREIHEVEAGFVPDMDNSVLFYREGHSRDHFLEKITETIETGLPCDIEAQIITARGNKKWIRVVAEAEFAGKRCIRVYGSFQDIDNRKKAELAALDALREKNSILESIGDCFFAVDRNWIVTYWNSAAEKKMSRPRETIIGANLWDIYPDAVELESYRQYHEAMRTGNAAHFEGYYVPLDTWFDVSAYPSKNGLSVFLKDITEAKKTVWALEESEKRYSDMFHLSPQPMFVYEIGSLRFLDVNSAAVENYGYSREEFLSMTIREIRPPEDIPILEKIVTDRRAEKSARLLGTYRHTKKDGEIIHVNIQSNVINYKGVTAKVVLATDITAQLNYIKAVETQNEKLKEISWIQSHLVRAPLARIMGLVPFINSKDANEAEQQLIKEYILESAKDLDDVIRSITDTTKTVKIS